MDDALLEVILGRLDTVALGEEATDMLLGACEGDEALAQVLGGRRPPATHPGGRWQWGPRGSRTPPITRTEPRADQGGGPPPGRHIGYPVALRAARLRPRRVVACNTPRAVVERVDPDLLGVDDIFEIDAQASHLFTVSTTSTTSGPLPRRVGPGKLRGGDARDRPERQALAELQGRGLVDGSVRRTTRTDSTRGGTTGRELPPAPGDANRPDPRDGAARRAHHLRPGRPLRQEGPPAVRPRSRAGRPRLAPRSRKGI